MPLHFYVFQAVLLHFYSFFNYSIIILRLELTSSQYTTKLEEQI